jgi:two-component system, chemotaxis family, chemotaxis protein CheY
MEERIMMHSITKLNQQILKILIVDDDFYGRRLLQRMLSPYGECDLAVNGVEAVDAYERSLGDEFAYDLICLDLLMPVMDGQETLKRIRHMEDEREIFGDECVKIIITSAIDDKKNMLTAFRAGIEGYITKPVDKKKMLNKIKDLGLLS